MKAAQQKAAPLVLQTQGGQQKIEEISNQQKNFGFSVAARKGPDKSKEALVGKDGAVKEAEALAAAQAEYNRILRETIQTGGSADDAMKDFTKSMKGYKLEVTNADEIQEEFRKDIEETTQAALANRQGLSRGDNQKLLNAGKEMAGAQALQNTVNSAPIAAVQQNSQEQIQTQESINKALEQRVAELEQIIKLQKQETNAANQSSDQVISGLKAEGKEAEKNVKLQETIRGGFDRIGQGAKQILSVTTAWRSLRNVIRNTFNDVKNLDKSFASIAMVTNYSVKDMWAQYDQYAEMANRLGQSTQSVVEASGLYYQQGLKTNEVLKLTEETMKLATLAGLDFKEATSQMTAALRAFHMDMDQGAHVTDVYAEVAAHAAVDVQGLSEAMSACAAIANSAGMSFEKTTAMLATMVEATQEAPKNLGTAMKTILARFTELKTNVAGTAESEFDDLDYNKVDKALKGVGISIKDATGQFRNMDDVLIELSGKWNSLDRNTQRYIATTAAGSRQQSRFIALMENYERTMQLVDVAQNSVGRSSQQFAKYQDTVEYRLNKIKNSWEQFRTSLLDSDTYKGALDIFSGFLDKLNNKSATGLAALGATWLTVGRKAISGITDSWSKMTSGVLGGKGGLSTKLVEATIKRQEKKGTEPSEALKALKENPEQLKELGQDVGQIITTGLTSAITSGLMIDNPIAAGLTAAGTSAMSLLPTFIDIGKKLGAGTGTAIGVGVTAAIGAISLSISAWRKHLQDEENKTLSKRVENTKKQLEKETQLLEQKSTDRKQTQNEIKDLTEIKNKYAELNSKIILNEEEQEEYNKLVENLKENYPSLIEKYDAENNKIKLSNKLLDDKITKLKTIEKEQKQVELSVSLNKLDSSQDLNLLNIQKKYTEKILGTSNINLSGDSSSGFLSPVNLMDSLFSNIKFDGENFDQFSESIQNLAEKMGVSKDILETIKTDLKDFEAAYKQEQGIQEEEKYNELLAKLRDLYPDKTDTELSAYASAFSTKNSFKESQYAKINLDDLIEHTGIWSDFDTEDILDSKYFKKTAFSGNIVGDTMRGFGFGGFDFKDYKDMNDWSKKLLSSIGINSQDDLDNLLENYNPKQIIKKLEQAAENITDTEAMDKYIKDAPKKFEKITSDITKLKDKAGKLNVDEYLKQAESIKSFGLSFGQDKNVEKQLNLEQFEEYKKVLKQYKLETSKTFKDLDAETALQQGAILSNLTSRFGTVNQEEVGKNYESFIKYIKGLGLSKELTQTLLKIDPTSIDKDDIWGAQEQIEKALSNPELATHLGEEEAKNYAKGITSVLQQYNLSDFGISNETKLDQLKEKIQEKLTTIVKAYKTAMDKITSSIEDGFIDALDKSDIEDAIKEIGLKPEDYFYTDTKGNYQIDVEKLTAATKEQVSNEKAIVEQAKAQAEQGLISLQQKRDGLALLIKQAKQEGEILKIQKKQLENEAKIQAVKSGNGSTVGSILKQAGIEEDNGAFEISKQQLKDWEDELKDLDKEIEDWKKKINDPTTFEGLAGNTQALINSINNISKTYEKACENQKKTYKEAEENITKTKEAAEKAYKSWQKSIDDIIKKQKELNEAIQGTEFWDSGLDSMYNYTTALDTLSDKVEDAQKKMQNAVTLEEGRQAAQDYINSLAEKMTTLKAEAQVYQKRIDDDNKNWKNRLEQRIKSLPNSNQMKYNLDNYLTKDKNGNTQINIGALQKAKLPDNIKKLIVDEGKALVDNQKKLREILKQQEAIEEEFKQKRKEALQSYVDLEQKMADTLKEKYQKEIDDLKNKYSSMEEADNNYLDSLQKAIDKQRKLRDEENSWNDLANKERKLSLMRRDTSRGNAVEVKSLEKDVQEDREQLLDNAVDNIVDSLKEMYDLQKESRDAEIEYRESLLEDTQILKEVAEALKNIKDEDGLVQWFKDNTVGLKDMTDAQIQLEMENWKELFNAKSTYTNLSKKDFEDALLEQGQNVQDVVDTTSETLTTEANRVMDQVTEQTKEAIKAAKDALEQAKQTEIEQKKAWEEAEKAAKEAKKAFDELIDKLTVKGYVVKDTSENEYKYDNLQQAQSQAARLAEAGLLNGSVQKENILAWEAIRPANSTIGATGGQGKSSNEQPKTSSSSYKGNKLMTFFIDDYRNEILTSTEYDRYMQENHGKDYKDYKQQEVIVPEDVKHGVLTYRNGFWNFLMKTDKKEDAESYVQKRSTESTFKGLAFKQGGLVDYTGPAWVDGSRSNPEAFLSSEDTRRIGEAARILADLPILSQPVTKDTITNNTVGDTNIQIEVNVDQIASDYDVDDAVKRVEEQIVKAAKYAGSNVILTKR